MTIPTVEYRRGVYYVVLDGPTPRDRGHQHGQALEFPIRKAIAQFKRWIRENAGLDDPTGVLREFVDSSTHLAAVSTDAPDLLEENQAIAEGAGVPFEELFVYQSFDEFFMYLVTSGTLDPSSSGHCTTAAVFGDAAPSTLVAHNNDIPTYHAELVTVLRIRRPDSDVEILQSTFAGQIGQNGVNSHGVGVGINTVADLPGGGGMPVSFHVRRILECRSVDEAIEYLDSARFGQAMNYTIGDRRRAVTVETWLDNARVAETGGDGYVTHTNHSLLPDAPRTFEMSADSGGGSYSFTRERLQLADDTLGGHDSAKSIDGFKELFKTRPILVYPGKPTGRTLMNMIAEIPPDGPPTLHLTPDSPNLYDHATFTFD